MIRRLFAFSMWQCQPWRAINGLVTRSINAHWGIYVKSLDASEEIAINADDQMDTMSTIKIPLMAEAYRQAARPWNTA